MDEACILIEGEDVVSLVESNNTAGDFEFLRDNFFHVSLYAGFFFLLDQKREIERNFEKQKKKRKMH